MSVTATAQRKRTTRRKPATSKAEHYESVAVEAGVGTCKLIASQDAAGKYYGSFEMRWRNADGILKDANAVLCPSAAVVFDELPDARTFAATAAIEYMGHLLLGRTTKQQAKAIDIMLETLHEVRFTASASKKKRPPKGGTTNGEETRIVAIPMDKLHPHPANRHIDPPSCFKLAESMKAKGLQQPVKVRQPGEHWELPEGHFQIVFGERRYWAAQICEWDTIPAVVDVLTDEEVLDLIATENGQRKNLNDIEKAGLLKELKAAGRTVEAAGKVMDMAQSTASNIMRVAELPEYWTDLVISREMTSTQLRPVASVRTCAPLLRLLEKERREAADGTYLHERWASAEAVKETVLECLLAESRAVSAEDVIGYEWAKPTMELGRLDAKQVASLEIAQVTLEKGLTIQRCFCVDAWMKLNSQGKGKGKAKDKATPKKPVAAKEAAKRAAGIRDRAIDLVRLEMLRRGCADALGSTDAATLDTLWLLMMWGIGGSTVSHSAVQRAMAAALAARKLRIRPFGPSWPVLAKLKKTERASCARNIWREILYPGSVSGHVEEFDPEQLRSIIEDVAIELGVDLSIVWLDAQQGTTRAVWFARFFALHTKDELAALAKELGVNLFGKSSKKEMAAAFSIQQKPLKLPRSIKPLRAKKKTR